MLALGALALSVAALALVARLGRAQLGALAELRRLQELARTLSDRVAAVERSAGEAATQAEAAGTLLVEKGLADADDLEEARRRFGVEEELVLPRGPRSVH